MDTNEKFEEVYSKIAESNDKLLESLRYKAKRATIKSIKVMLLIILLGILFVLLHKTMHYYYPDAVYISSDNIDEILDMAFMYLSFAFFSLLIISAKSRKRHIQYRKDFKSNVVNTLLNSFGENIKYYPSSGISSIAYENAEFEDSNRFWSEDLMQGTLKNGCNFEMAEVITELANSGSARGDLQFHGMFAKIEIPKSFDFCLYIRRDIKDKNIVARKLESKLSLDDLRVELDLHEFEKIFDVYCSDKIIALQVLTADIMQLLIDFYKENNMDYELTIKGNHIYIRFMSDLMFEPANVFKSSLDKSTLYEHYNMLNFAFSLSDKLAKAMDKIYI